MSDRAALVAALAQAGFTPGRKHLAPLIDLLLDSDDHAAAIRRALGRADVGPVIAAITRALPTAAEPAAARLIAALGDAAARDATARAHLLAALDDPRPRARRAAVTALGKLGGDEVRVALAAFWDRDLPADQRRATAEALGKVGGAEALARLRGAGVNDDPVLAQRRARGLLMATRDDTAPSEIALDVPPPAAVALVARCRPGLEPVLLDELTELALPARPDRDGRVQLTYAGPLEVPLRARTLLSLGVLVELGPGDLLDTVPAALSAAPIRQLLAAWTRGPIRWRLDFERGGPRRALVWDLAARVQAVAPELVNQPRATTWDVIVLAGERQLELRPRRFVDARFAWRVADVPASSHPTIAAALIRVAGARPGERVWDPFVGAGAELCERARLGTAHLMGTDLTERALSAARANLDAAGATDTELVCADALTFSPAPLDLIVTNPPMGRRIRGDAGGLLERFAARVPGLLAPRGRLVWLTPAPARTGPVLAVGGLRSTFARDVDLGGYTARLERWDRR